MARALILTLGLGARQEAAIRSGIVAISKRHHEVLRRVLVNDAIAALKAGEIE